MFAIKLAFAGISTAIWTWGTGVGIIIILLAVDYFLGYLPFVSRFRKDILWLAVAIGVGLACVSWGQKVETKHCDAKAAAVNSQVEKAVTDANGKPVRRKKYEIND